MTILDSLGTYSREYMSLLFILLSHPPPFPLCLILIHLFYLSRAVISDISYLGYLNDSLIPMSRTMVLDMW